MKNMKTLNFIIKYAVPITLVIVSVLFIFSKVDTGKTIEGLKDEISISESRILSLEYQALSHAAEMDQQFEFIQQQNLVIVAQDIRIKELDVIEEKEYAEIDDLRPDQYQAEIDKYYNPRSELIVADLDSSQAINVIKSVVENKFMKDRISLMTIQRISLDETIVARDEIISNQIIQIDLLNEIVLEYRNINSLDNEKYKKLFKKYRRQKWLVRGVAAIGVAAVILTN